MVLPEKKKKQIKFQTHNDASYYTKFVSIDSEFSLPEMDNFPQQETYVGENAAEHFLDYVQDVAGNIYKKYIDSETASNDTR